MKMRITIELSQQEVDVAVGKSITAGFMREAPGKRWTDGERKEAIVFLVDKYIRSLN